MRHFILKRASASRPSGEWSDDDYDVLADGAVVGRIFEANAGPVGSPWMWTLAFGHHEDHTPTHGYEPTRDGAMAAFARRVGGGKSLTIGSRRQNARCGCGGPIDRANTIMKSECVAGSSRRLNGQGRGP
jgi:hypothetical protein